MTQPDTDILAALDFNEIACQCARHGDACGNRAIYAVHIHALHNCNQPGLTFGNRVEFRCVHCLLALQAEVHERLKRLAKRGVGACDTCGAPIAEVRDVVRDWAEL